MRKKFLMFIAVIVTIVLVDVWFRSINMNELKDIFLGDIEEITIHDPVGYYTIDEQKDVQLIFEVLQSMHLSRKINSHKDGFAFLIDIKLYDGEIIEICVLSNDIHINRHNYKPDKDYINYIREIYNKLSQKYENYPA